jgi:hypothetical protein
MALSWNEIKSRAIHFSNEWENETSEDAEAKSFWDDFFNVFGISRRRVATFETKVTKGNRKDGYIDLLWKGNLLVEHKSAGKDLDRAYKQAIDYFPGLKDHELPKFIIVCNFKTFRVYDLEDNGTIEFELSEFVNNIQLFSFIAGYQKHTYKEQDPVNIEAALLMGKLHDKLKAVGYTGHPLEVYLVRLLFCLFADDTTIFEKDIFKDFIVQRTSEDGSDLAARLSEFFYILNTPLDKRLKNIDEQLNSFPWVNGKLFEETLPPASFDSQMRQILLECCNLNWGKISPAIFGSMFQSVMNPKERRNLGAHYTSETNILKLIKPLFLDDLWKEFESIKNNKNKLVEFHNKLSKLRFLDPACGCGNFLVITYRELRLLEIEILRLLNSTRQGVLDVREIILLDVDMMFGVECEEFPARIAEVAMWLIDHQMNMLISSEFGQYFVRLPLKKAANIYYGNSLQVDWETLIGKNDLSYILGNPPFVGKSNQSSKQKKDMNIVFQGLSNTGVLDYVSAWYLKAAKFIQGTKIKVAFVSTNSISQGEQVGVLWNLLYNVYKIKIHFAHRTFRWSNEAKKKAAVHVVIIGFADFDSTNKSIFEYEHIKGEPHEYKVKNINPYLLEGNDNFVKKRRKPISDVPEMIKGSMPNDGGYYLFSREEKESFLLKEPFALKYFKPFIGGYEFLNSVERWCLWLLGANPTEIKSLPLVLDRIEKVRLNRLESNRLITQKDASTPMLFGEIRQPDSDYLALPEVSSENRNYIPVGYVGKNTIASNKIYMVPDATLYTFGILCSSMHNAWINQISGRLKSDISYSTGIVYNNFPWPISTNKKQKKAIEEAAQKVLDVRLIFPKSSLADLYDPLTMPPSLVKAHNELDKAVDMIYRSQPFISYANRMVFLFELYEKYTADLFTNEKSKPKKIKATRLI